MNNDLTFRDTYRYTSFMQTHGDIRFSEFELSISILNWTHWHCKGLRCLKNEVLP